jgi:hypothetical protein
MTALGIATGWNPAAIGVSLAVDAMIGLPIWYGGAQLFGWAFRSVRVHLNATQRRNCPGQIWSNDELVIRVPGRVLAQYPAEQHHWKEGQLEANLKVAVAAIIDAASEKIALRPCAVYRK